MQKCYTFLGGRLGWGRLGNRCRLGELPPKSLCVLWRGENSGGEAWGPRKG